MSRVIVYIDGFNLYHGLREKKWRCFYWLNVHQLADNLLKPHQHLISVRYFTARISASSDNIQEKEKKKRQTIYLDALATLPDTNLIFGRYLPKKRKCANCNWEWKTYEEKKTDVNIAVSLLIDAQDDEFDTAIVVSADSDLTPPIDAILRRYPEKRVVVAFPPKRYSNELKKVASGWLSIDRITLKSSQFPKHVETTNGFFLQQPQKWT